MAYLKETSKDGYLVAITPAEASYIESTSRYNRVITGNVVIFFLK